MIESLRDEDRIATVREHLRKHRPAGEIAYHRPVTTERSKETR
jgi:hypothetical protein